MAVILGPNQYGKAETRLVRVVRDGARHDIRDLNVSVTLRGDFAAAHVDGDQSGVLPTDTQKNTVFAFAKKYGVGEIEDFARLLARHFVADISSVHRARVDIDEYAWGRIDVDGEPHDHGFVRAGDGNRTTTVTVEEDRSWIVSGVKDLTVLKTTGSEFRGFAQDEYTTLPETADRILATSLVTRWRYGTDAETEWGETHTSVRRTMLARFADVHSYALQHTLYMMGEAVLDTHPRIAEIRFSAPNKHHFRYDLAPFGLDNPGEVFHATDRPYGLIEATVTRDDASDSGAAW